MSTLQGANAEQSKLYENTVREHRKFATKQGAISASGATSFAGWQAGAAKERGVDNL